MKISTLRKHKGNPEIKDSRGFLSFNDSLLVFKKKKNLKTKNSTPDRLTDQGRETCKAGAVWETPDINSYFRTRPFCGKKKRVTNVLT